MNQKFEISGDFIELNKLLKASGLCGTGGMAKMVIKDGLVTVDKKVETRVRRKIKTGMTVHYNSQIIKVKSEK
ncbi:RNA-binding S4 domain-containing protein [bacterium]|nr:RNA-binding S4 domain-containing protein [bacterium]